MKYCLFSVSYAGFWGQHRLSLEEFIRKAGALGYGGVEIMSKKPHFYPYDVSAGYLGRIKRVLGECGLEVPCLAAYTNFGAGAESAEVPIADLQVSYVRKTAELAKELGAPLIRVFTAYENPVEPFAVQWKKGVENIRACCDAAAEYGVKIGIQNHHDLAVHTKSLLEFYYEVDRPNLGLMPDLWSMQLRGEDLSAALDLVKEQTIFSTVADYVILPRYNYHPALVNYQEKEPPLVKAVPMGSGELDYETYFNTLRKSGYDGWVSYEMCSPLRGGGSLENLDFCAQKFLSYMQARGF